MALVNKISLKDRLLAAAKNKEAPAEEANASKEGTLVQALPVIAEAAKQIVGTEIDQSSSDAPIFDVAAQQAYADILPRIDALTALSGEDLGKEMGILKKALIENPDACSIMLPQDIGKMVEALRRITGQALSEATAKPKGQKKQKQLILTTEAMEAAFDEL